MKKKLACMLLMGTLALSMAACGGGRTKDTGAATENCVGKYRVCCRAHWTSVESTEAGQMPEHSRKMEMRHRHYRAPKKQ